MTFTAFASLASIVTTDRDSRLRALRVCHAELHRPGATVTRASVRALVRYVVAGDRTVPRGSVSWGSEKGVPGVGAELESAAASVETVDVTRPAFQQWVWEEASLVAEVLHAASAIAAFYRDFRPDSSPAVADRCNRTSHGREPTLETEWEKPVLRCFYDCLHSTSDDLATNTNSSTVNTHAASPRAPAASSWAQRAFAVMALLTCVTTRFGIAPHSDAADARAGLLSAAVGKIADVALPLLEAAARHALTCVVADAATLRYVRDLGFHASHEAVQRNVARRRERDQLKGGANGRSDNDDALLADRDDLDDGGVLVLDSRPPTTVAPARPSGGADGLRRDTTASLVAFASRIGQTYACVDAPTLLAMRREYGAVMWTVAASPLVSSGSVTSFAQAAALPSTMTSYDSNSNSYREIRFPTAASRQADANGPLGATTTLLSHLAVAAQQQRQQEQQHQPTDYVVNATRPVRWMRCADVVAQSTPTEESLGAAVDGVSLPQWSADVVVTLQCAVAIGELFAYLFAACDVADDVSADVVIAPVIEDTLEVLLGVTAQFAGAAALPGVTMRAMCAACSALAIRADDYIADATDPQRMERLFFDRVRDAAYAYLAAAERSAMPRAAAQVAVVWLFALAERFIWDRQRAALRLDAGAVLHRMLVLCYDVTRHVQVAGEAGIGWLMPSRANAGRRRSAAVSQPGPTVFLIHGVGALLLAMLEEPTRGFALRSRPILPQVQAAVAAALAPTSELRRFFDRYATVALGVASDGSQVDWQRHGATGSGSNLNAAAGASKSRALPFAPVDRVLPMQNGAAAADIVAAATNEPLVLLPDRPGDGARHVAVLLRLRRVINFYHQQPRILATVAPGGGMFSLIAGGASIAASVSVQRAALQLLLADARFSGRGPADMESLRGVVRILHIAFLRTYMHRDFMTEPPNGPLAQRCALLLEALRTLVLRVPEAAGALAATGTVQTLTSEVDLEFTFAAREQRIKARAQEARDAGITSVSSPLFRTQSPQHAVPAALVPVAIKAAGPVNISTEDSVASPVSIRQAPVAGTAPPPADLFPGCPRDDANDTAGPGLGLGVGLAAFGIPKLDLAAAPLPLYFASDGDTGAAVNSVAPERLIASSPQPPPVAVHAPPPVKIIPPSPPPPAPSPSPAATTAPAAAPLVIPKLNLAGAAPALFFRGNGDTAAAASAVIMSEALSPGPNAKALRGPPPPSAAATVVHPPSVPTLAALAPTLTHKASSPTAHGPIGAIDAQFPASAAIGANAGLAIALGSTSMIQQPAAEELERVPGMAVLDTTAYPTEALDALFPIQRAARRIYRHEEVHAGIVLLLAASLLDRDGRMRPEYTSHLAEEEEQSVQKRRGRVLHRNVVITLQVHVADPANGRLRDSLLAAARSGTIGSRLSVFLTLLVPDPTFRSRFAVGDGIGRGAFGVVAACHVKAAPMVAAATTPDGGDVWYPLAVKQVPLPSAVSSTATAPLAKTMAEATTMLAARLRCSSDCAGAGFATEFLEAANDGVHYNIVMRRYSMCLSTWRGRNVDCALSLLDVLVVFRAVVQQVARLHAVSIVHGDIKCGNVMMTRTDAATGRPVGIVLADFGDAELIPSGASGVALSNGGGGVGDRGAGEAIQGLARGRERPPGTEVVRPPEMWLRDRFQPTRKNLADFLAARDIWALGCLLYELCTGGTLFEDGAAAHSAVFDACAVLSSVRDRGYATSTTSAAALAGSGSDGDAAPTHFLAEIVLSSYQGPHLRAVGQSMAQALAGCTAATPAELELKSSPLRSILAQAMHVDPNARCTCSQLLNAVDAAIARWDVASISTNSATGPVPLASTPPMIASAAQVPPPALAPTDGIGAIAARQAKGAEDESAPTPPPATFLSLLDWMDWELALFNLDSGFWRVPRHASNAVMPRLCQVAPRVLLARPEATITPAILSRFGVGSIVTFEPIDGADRLVARRDAHVVTTPCSLALRARVLSLFQGLRAAYPEMESRADAEPAFADDEADDAEQNADDEEENETSGDDNDPKSGQEGEESDGNTMSDSERDGILLEAFSDAVEFLQDAVTQPLGRAAILPCPVVVRVALNDRRCAIQGTHGKRKIAEDFSATVDMATVLGLYYAFATYGVPPHLAASSALRMWPAVTTWVIPKIDVGGSTQPRRHALHAPQLGHRRPRPVGAGTTPQLMPVAHRAHLPYSPHHLPRGPRTPTRRAVTPDRRVGVGAPHPLPAPALQLPSAVPARPARVHSRSAAPAPRAPPPPYDIRGSSPRAYEVLIAAQLATLMRHKVAQRALTAAMILRRHTGGSAHNAGGIDAASSDSFGAAMSALDNVHTYQCLCGASTVACSADVVNAAARTCTLRLVDNPELSSDECGMVVSAAVDAPGAALDVLRGFALRAHLLYDLGGLAGVVASASSASTSVYATANVDDPYGELLAPQGCPLTGSARAGGAGGGGNAFASGGDWRVFSEAAGLTIAAAPSGEGGVVMRVRLVARMTTHENIGGSELKAVARAQGWLETVSDDASDAALTLRCRCCAMPLAWADAAEAIGDRGSTAFLVGAFRVGPQGTVDFRRPAFFPCS